MWKDVADSKKEKRPSKEEIKKIIIRIDGHIRSHIGKFLNSH